MMQINRKYVQTRFWKLYARFISYAFFEGRPLTTRGRWINPLVFSVHKTAMLLPQLKKVVSPIFILGTGRSGTTILGIVMSMHKEVGFLNEPKALWHSINMNEDLIGSYTMEKASYRLNKKNANKKQKKDIHKIFSAYLTLTFSKRVVDKYPELIFRVSYVKELFPDAKFLFLVRNGWDTCASIEKWSDRLGVSKNLDTYDWWGVNNRKWNLLIEQIIKKDDYFDSIIMHIDEIKNHHDMAALEWIATMREGLKLSKIYPDSILRVNYENLVNEPEKTLSEIETFCELSLDDIYNEYGKKVLKPGKSAEVFTLHPSIHPLFIETMKELGYK